MREHGRTGEVVSKGLVVQSVTEVGWRTEAPGQEVASVLRENRRLKGVAVVLAVSLALFAGVTPFGNGLRGLTAEQEQMVETIDTYLAAWNSGNAAAGEAVMTPDAFFEDASGRWMVADGSHADYLRLVHSLGMRFYRVGEPVAVDRIVIVPTGSSENAPSPAPDVYYMSPDGTEILWMIEP